ncbi:zinc-binding alcohol dehydrogenase family protein [Domibacillus indicus]|uniref:zinc-binding alcohol dehydrogenase family protein n=1 Tax=Domibacillus indicus TaxID=1437523 RepID=UPI00203C6CB3|nr:zinc-binding alcohol dehydrogenase family protein [Domibacillus indicus]MCM3790537.1 zinc-binding alcohol dehydrogenase family protein [Domibacillus indicus]
MKTIVCKEPNHLKMSDVYPPVAKEGEAIVRIRRIGICGTDLHAFKGNQPYFTYPRILGHELSGIIESAGKNESAFKEGDQVSIIPYLACGKCVACKKGRTNCCTDINVLGVHIDGGMSELISVRFENLIKTDSLTLDQSAVIEPLSIGAHAIRRSGIQKGENVLVIGAGPIGLGVMAFAKKEGAHVTAMDVNEERLQFCRQWANVDEIVNAMDNAIDKISEITCGEMPIAVFDATGSATSMMNAFQFTSHAGKLIYVGLVKSEISFSHPDFHKKELTLMGSRNATREDFQNVIDAITEGKMNLDAYITHRAQFDEVVEQFEKWLDPKEKVIKAIVEL